MYSLDAFEMIRNFSCAWANGVSNVKSETSHSSLLGVLVPIGACPDKISCIQNTWSYASLNVSLVCIRGCPTGAKGEAPRPLEPFFTSYPFLRWGWGDGVSSAPAESFFVSYPVAKLANS